jgi:organic hydroperoxide reductase OsmC/OhrA
MAATFPHRYHVRVEGGSGGAVLSAPPRPDLHGGAPTEFGGRDDWWSPEHLLLSAAGLCLKTTFEAFASRAHLDVLSYSSQVEGNLDKTPQGLAFTFIAVAVELVVAEADVARAGDILRTAKDHCIVGNALKTPIRLAASVVRAPTPVPA